MANDTRFKEVVEEILELHERKALDYGSDEDPLANVRAAEDFGIPAWLGATIRMRDKMHRLARFAKRGNLANESVEDSFKDLAVYALIALILYREETPKTVPQKVVYASLKCATPLTLDEEF